MVFAVQDLALLDLLLVLDLSWQVIQGSPFFTYPHVSEDDDSSLRELELEGLPDGQTGDGFDPGQAVPEASPAPGDN